MNEEYKDFCVSIKRDYGLNINPEDEFFPLIYQLITSNKNNEATISELKIIVNDGLKGLSETNNNLYENQACLLNKTTELLQKIPKTYAMFSNTEASSAYWKGKAKYTMSLILSISVLIFISTLSYFFINNNRILDTWFMTTKIEQYGGREFIMLDKINNSEELCPGINCIEWQKGRIAIPLTK